jgi:class 3 adenylate cyclase/tetratricopeptide (TPR) repeat protein
VVCPACAAENRDGARFCNECGTPLALRCAACGAPHHPGQRFCDECGAPLAAPAEPAPAAELRVVSVLFVDLVGYTSLSESRDAEDVRELLSRYFDHARTIVARYGGTVEKFIGDAVMAVWGTPVAREDDAERAVRAGLELVDAVAAFGEEVGAPQLRARAGVVTGQVASVAHPGEGLVVGDRVNTASRVQSTAEPGTVYVDEVTRQASSAAIAYADTGEHAVKGKAEPLRLWRAERVVAGSGGSRREQGLQAPFLGRDPELRLLKELFHTAVDRRQARLITITGPAGVGKSRLREEFLHYVDGLLDTVLWHSGRCLSYGDGVAYWALAEMVRQRLGIEEDAPPEAAERKLALGLERWITEPADRAFLAPRLGALIGIAEPASDRHELFAAWRLFFERLAEQSPVVLAFEDVQWADDGLLDFVDHLVEWSAGKAIVVLALARPELIDRRAAWAGGRPGVTPVYLEPLPDAVTGELLDAMVTGLPGAVRERIVAQAEGIALYALETVRALADRGMLAETDGRLAVQGDIGEDLAVPASLSSLLTARLDNLAPEERTLAKDLAVMGGTFPRGSVSAVSGLPEDRIDALLASLVRKQVLAVRADPLSPDSGQYGFAQTLLRTVAYDMLSRRERKERHVAVAAHLRRAFANDGEEMAEVVAAHLLDGYRAAGSDSDADELRREALEALRRGARRAAGVGAPEKAERAYLTAVELAGDAAERAELLELAGRMASASGRYEAALAHHEQARELVASLGDDRGAARLTGPIARELGRLGRTVEAAERAREALASPGAADDEVRAALETELGVALTFAGRTAEAERSLQTGIELAQALELPSVFCRALMMRATLCAMSSRIEEAGILYAGAVEYATRHGLTADRARALSNSADLQWRFDVPGAAAAAGEAVESYQRMGDRAGESISAANHMALRIAAGEWDAAILLADELGYGADRPAVENLLARLVVLHALRGEVELGRAKLEAMAAWRDTDDAEARDIYEGVAGALGVAEGPTDALLEHLTHTLRESLVIAGAAGEGPRQLWPDAFDAALALGRHDRAEELIDLLAAQPRGHTPPFLRTQLTGGRGRLAAARGEQEAAEPDLREAVVGYERLAMPYWHARAQTDLAASLRAQGRGDEASGLLDEAAATLQRLGAAPALDRVLRLRDEQPQDAVGA